MPKIIVTIDPGSKGGIAYQLPNGSVACFNMPETEGDILEELRNISLAEPLAGGIEIVAFLEEVGGYTGGPAPGSMMFNFGDNFGFLKGVLMALGYRVELVRPQKWQRALGLPKSGASKSLPRSVQDRLKREHKNRMKEKAQQLYPKCKVTLQTADALLLLEFAKQASVLSDLV